MPELDSKPAGAEGHVVLRGPNGLKVMIPTVLLAGLVAALCTRIVGTPKTENDDRNAAKLDAVATKLERLDAKVDALVDRINRDDDKRSNAELIQAQRLLEQLRKTGAAP